MARASAILAVLLTLTLGQNGKSDTPTPSETMVSLVQNIESGTIGKVEVLCIPDGVVFAVAMTPERLETAWHYKFTVRDFRGDPLAEKLIDAIKDTTLSELAWHGDTRWAFHFYDLDNKDVVTLYSDYSGNMVINGRSVKSKGPLLKELKKFCPICADM